MAETGAAGYTESQSGDCADTIGLGESKSCTIANDITPALTVTKSVINEDEGTAAASNFTIDVAATDPSSPSIPPVAADSLNLVLSLSK